MIGMYAEPKPKGFGFSDTAFRIFILMASRRLESDRFFTDDYRPEVYTQAGHRLGREQLDAVAAPAALPRARAGARGRREPVRALEAHERGDVMTELAPGIHSLGHGKGGHVHAFLIDDGGELSLVDTLFESDAGSCFEAIRSSAGARGPEADRDHARAPLAPRRDGGARSARAARRLYAHEWEADIVAGDRRAQAVSILPRQSLRLIPFQLGLWLDRPKHAPCPVDELLDDGDAFGPLQVLHAPGHSPGHLAFWWPERRFLIAGDGVATWPELCPGWHCVQPEPAAAPRDAAAPRRPRRRHRRRRPRRPDHGGRAGQGARAREQAGALDDP